MTRGRLGSVVSLFSRNAQGGEEGRNYRPIEPISHALEVRLVGPENPTVRRMTSLIFHVFNVILVYVLAVQLSRIKLVGLIAGLLFAVHPLHAQQLPPIAWVSGRTDLFVTFFYLLSLLLFTRALTKRSYLLYGLSLLSFTLALLSKEMAVTLPLIIVAYLILAPSATPPRHPGPTPGGRPFSGRSC